MPHYLATFTQKDGEHEYLERMVFEAKTLEEARSLALAECFEYGDEAEGLYLSYQDGQTSVELEGIQEITAAEYQTILKLRLT